ncbi:SPOC domain-like protein [Trametopsis cervina]|nr:SPOC domain-like protein [Trametopsis cervina]
MFLVDVSPSMGKVREVEVEQPNGDKRSIEMTNLEWSLQFVKLKVQEMIYNGRKTDQCGVILFGTEETNNIVNMKDGGYDHVSEYIPIGTPSVDTIAKLSEIMPGDTCGDPIDALIVGIETQAKYLITKRTWTRRMVLLTDGESPIEIEDWEATAGKMNDLKIRFTIVGVDFDDEEYPFEEEEKTNIKRANEEFYHKFVGQLENGVVGNAAFALAEISRPEVKQTKSALLGTVLRLGDTETNTEESIEITVKVSKCTSLARPKTWKKFALRRRPEDPEDVVMKEPDDEDDERKVLFAQLGMKTKYVLDSASEGEQEDDETSADATKEMDPVEKEDLIRGFKYGTSYAPCPDGTFPRLPTRKGIDICGIISKDNYRHDWALGEVQYIWADPNVPTQQVALSSIANVMNERGYMAIARWVSKDGADPKMGVLKPEVFEDTDCFLWMPFADDLRKYPFASLERLTNKKGEIVTKHPFLPTNEQMDAMENFVDAMDLMEAGEKDEDGVRGPWFETNLSFNPAIHRVKQAQFHAAVVSDLNKQPVPPPHPELLKYFEPPRRVLKKAKGAIDEVKAVFKVREVPKRITRTRKDDHVRARDEGDDTLLLEKHPNKKRKVSGSQSQTQYSTPQATTSPKSQRNAVKKSMSVSESDSETEPESDQDLLLDKKDEKKDISEVEPPPSPTSQAAPSSLDSDRLPGRIIGMAYPLEDFKTNIASGDLVTKAVEDLAFVIKTIVMKPYSSRRTPEMLQCMQELRKVATEEDEIDAWNDFLLDLKSACLESKPGNSEFWERVTDFGRDISLVSKLEAARLGGKSNISEAQAAEFIRVPN